MREPGHYIDIPARGYHELPYLGSSSFKRLAESPGIFDFERKNPSPSSDEQRIGEATHTLVMEPAKFDSVAVLSPHDEYRTNEAKKWKADTIAAGVIPLKSPEWATVQRMRDALLAHRSASALLKPADDVLVESTIIFDAYGMRCKARPDVFRAKEGIIVDVKTTRLTNEREWEREVATTGLYFQPWWYLLAAELATDAAPSRFIWCVVGKERPHPVWCREASPAWVELARKQGERLIETYKACDEADVWPLSSDGIELSEPPAWFGREYAV